jgi:hypothetical protein
MDELFLLPPAPVAMPRAYRMEDFFLSSQIIVIEPSEESWQRVENAIEHHKGHDYDLDILNKVFGKSTLLIPYRDTISRLGSFDTRLTNMRRTWAHRQKPETQERFWTRRNFYVNGLTDAETLEEGVKRTD